MNYKLNFYTQYHQFYLCAKESPQDTGDSGFWTEEATQFRLAIGDGVLGVGLECYGDFKGELAILDKEKDHIVEGGLNVRSGILQVLDCPNSSVELEIKVYAGIYRVRIYSINLASVLEDSGDDYYKIEIWPGLNIERTVLKQYSPQSLE